MGEVGEVAEIFQWKGEVKTGLEGFTEAEKIHVGEEISDVLAYLIRLADMSGIDLAEAFMRKIAKNRSKYPKEQVNGNVELVEHYKKIKWENKAIIGKLLDKRARKTSKMKNKKEKKLMMNDDEKLNYDLSPLSESKTNKDAIKVLQISRPLFQEILVLFQKQRYLRYQLASMGILKTVRVAAFHRNLFQPEYFSDASSFLSLNHRCLHNSGCTGR